MAVVTFLGKGIGLDPQGLPCSCVSDVEAGRGLATADCGGATPHMIPISMKSRQMHGTIVLSIIYGTGRIFPPINVKRANMNTCLGKNLAKESQHLFHIIMT